mgnify:CR=1 FL=1
MIPTILAILMIESAPLRLRQRVTTLNEEELELKFDNWGHNVDINKKQFLEKWENVNENNYKSMENFFYLDPKIWNKVINLNL